MTDKPLVAIAMSGGVDSSVAAALLQEQGYSVFGLMLRLWSEPGLEKENQCCTPDSMAQARRVAARLGFPFYVIDAREYFYKMIVQSFIAGYRSGITPNPCMICNQTVRWGFLWEKAAGLGAKYMATGHYARLQRCEEGNFLLLRGIDKSKDQSYVLSRLTQDQLVHSLFPLGGLLKSQVKEIADKYQLGTANRKESQDLCFLGGRDYRGFMERQEEQAVKRGEIVDSRGKVLGEHEGLVGYTIGQRKGLGLFANRPLYVLMKDQQTNRLVVGTEEELSFGELIAGDARWLRGVIPEGSFKAEVKIRYRAKPATGTIEILDEKRFRATFEEPLRDITPGQYAVLYEGDVVLGSGIIETSSLR
ncbi:MAG: tRNA 2-thiouridine(34) synthase MnmA [Anaerolineaceae bacterium]|nr:tRNA 2-thiouridine(34) synthase MnmA [Anaerolineaceae bacterium]